jgi:hypothetical protein
MASVKLQPEKVTPEEKLTLASPARETKSRATIHMGTLGGFAPPFGPPPATPPRSLRSASPNPPAMVRHRRGRARSGQGAGPSQSPAGDEADGLPTRLAIAGCRAT